MNPNGVYEDLEATLIEGLERSEDVCEIKPPACAGNLGFTRKTMPQISAEVMPRFLAHLADMNVKVEPAKVEAGSLRPSQGEINATKTLGMARAYRDGKFPGLAADPILVTADGYVADGHHRWSAALAVSPKFKMPVYRAYMPIRELLREANDFEGVEQADFKAGSKNPRGLVGRVDRAARDLYPEGLDVAALAILYRAAEAGDAGDATAAREVSDVLASRAETRRVLLA